MTAGRLRESVAFDSPTSAPDGYGGTEDGWSEEHACRAEFIHQRGNEAVDAARLTGSQIYKVKIRSNAESRAILAGWRMRDVRRSVVYNIRSVDSVTDRQWVWLQAESGVAT